MGENVESSVVTDHSFTSKTSGYKLLIVSSVPDIMLGLDTVKLKMIFSISTWVHDPVGRKANTQCASAKTVMQEIFEIIGMFCL